jgi:geranylgeranyl pyrophosphate synthase
MNSTIPDSIDACLHDVRLLMAESLSRTVLSRITSAPENLFGNGKMLRSRLIFRVGPAAQAPYQTLLHAAAAVEMVHAASLLHDDVIDGGYLRRGAPTFWVERGISGAILVGDMMLFKAVELTCAVEDVRLTSLLVRLTGEVCDAESEQELILRGKTPNWENAVRIARRKTGALFAFAAGACGGADATLIATLTESGYAIGTAYQLADDILDSTGTEQVSGKSMGSDEARGKTTAATVDPNLKTQAVAFVEDLCAQAEAALADWPVILGGWQSFMAEDMRPALKKNLACVDPS